MEHLYNFSAKQRCTFVEKKNTMTTDTTPPYRPTGHLAIIGAVVMLTGAVLWGTSGTDLWAALANGDIAGYLAATSKVKTQLIANLSFWILGVLLMGMAGSLIADWSKDRPVPAKAALMCIYTAVPLAIVSFIAMLALVVQIAPGGGGASAEIAAAIGWFGTRADGVATVLIIGAAPLLLSVAGKGNWAPNWIVIWGCLAGAAGLLSIIALYVPALSDLEFIIIPVGIGWMIAAGIALRKK